jgi:hypothetical protein
MRRALTGSIKRPADTTTYAAGDVIGTAASQVITFFNARDPNGDDVNKGLILGAQVVDSAAPATLPSLELWMFDTAPTAAADNTAWAVTDAELAAGFLGVIPLSYTYVGLASGNHVQRSDTTAIPFEVKASDGSLYGVLVARNAYVPISEEVFKVILAVVD